MSRLKAVQPEKLQKRLKMFLFGPSGVGKTLASLAFPSAYIIDCEKGCENYPDIIKASGSVILQSNDSEEITEQIELLLTEKHPYKTLIIDPVTVLYLSIQDKWLKKFEREAIDSGKTKNADMQDFGMRYWGKVKRDYKAVQRLIARLDMNVIVTAHQKDVYGANMSKMGVTFDSMKGDDYFYDFVFRLEKRGKDRYAVTEKQRTQPDKPTFPEDFLWSYPNFVAYYGKEAIERSVTPVALATKEQVEELELLISTLNIDSAITDKWQATADVSDWKEMTSDEILKGIKYCKGKLDALKTTPEPEKLQIKKGGK